MTAPYNAPADPGRPPTMDGFVTDYISAFTAEMGRQPDLRRVRADHDRLHARADAGHLGAGPRLRHVRSLVLRGAVADVHQPVVLPRRDLVRLRRQLPPTDTFPVHNTAETIFERLEAQGLTWRVYCDPPSAHLADRASSTRPGCATGSRRTSSPPTSSSRTRSGAAADLLVHRAADLLHGHNDMHPAFDALYPGAERRPAVVAARRRGPAGPDLRRDPVIVIADRLELPQHAAHGQLRRARRDLRPRPAAGRDRRPTRPARPGRWASLSTGSASACPAIAISAWIPEQTVVNDAVPQHVGDPHPARTLEARRSRSPPATPTRRTSPRSCPSTNPAAAGGLARRRAAARAGPHRTPHPAQPAPHPARPGTRDGMPRAGPAARPDRAPDQRPGRPPRRRRPRHHARDRAPSMAEPAPHQHIAPVADMASHVNKSDRTSHTHAAQVCARLTHDLRSCAGGRRRSRVPSHPRS